MSATQSLTYEQMMTLFSEAREQMLETSRETDRQFREAREQMLETDRRIARQQEETDRMFRETRKRMQETDKKISALGSRIGEIVENMVGSDIVGQFQALDIAIHSHSRDKTFGVRGTNESGQIDVFLENGDIVILIEVKAKLTDDDVREHTERLEKYRRHGGDKRRILGAVAGAVASKEVIDFAHKKGLFVIVQSGEAVRIVPPPDGFVAKTW